MAAGSFDVLFSSVSTTISIDCNGCVCVCNKSPVKTGVQLGQGEWSLKGVPFFQTMFADCYLLVGTVTGFILLALDMITTVASQQVPLLTLLKVRRMGRLR